MTEHDQSSKTSVRSSLRIWEEREQEHRETLLRLQTQIEAKNREMSELTKELAEHAALVQEVETYEKILHELKSKLNEGKEKLARSREEIEAQERRLAFLQEKTVCEETRSAEVRTEVEHLRQTVAFLTGRCGDLRTEESRLNGELASLTSVLETHKAELREQEGEAARRQHLIGELDARIASQEAELRGLDERKETLGFDTRKAIAELDSVTAKVVDKRKELAAVESRTEELTRCSAQLEARSRELEQRNEAVRGEFARLQILIGEKNCELATLLEQREKMAGEVRHLQEQREQLVKNLQEIEQQVTEARVEASALESQKRAHESDVASALGRLNALKSEESRREEILAKMLEQIRFYEDRIASLHDKNVEFEMSKRVLKDEIRRGEDKLALLNEDCGSLVKKIGVVRSELGELGEEKIRLAAEVRDLLADRQARLVEIELAAKKAQEESRRLENLSAEVVSRREAIQDLEAEKERRRADLQVLEARLSELHEKEKDCIGRKSALEARLDSLVEQSALAERSLSDVIKRVEGQRAVCVQETEKAAVALDLAQKNAARLEETARQLTKIYSERDSAQVDLLEMRRQALERTEEIAELEALRQDKLQRIEQLQKEIGSFKEERDRVEEQARQGRTTQTRLASLKKTLLRLQTEAEDEVIERTPAKAS